MECGGASLAVIDVRLTLNCRSDLGVEIAPNCAAVWIRANGELNRYQLLLLTSVTIVYVDCTLAFVYLFYRVQKKIIVGNFRTIDLKILK